jgi:hypothetical protein
VRWLFLIGIGLDLSGALLIASAVLARTPGENREESTTRLNQNFWVVLIREREQSRVQAGALLLVLGFTCQALAYVIAFNDAQLVAAIAVVPAVIAATYIAGNWFAERRVPLKYQDELDLPAGILDERRGYHLADEAQVLEWRRLYCLRMHGREPEPSSTSVATRINAGRCLFDCPFCKWNATMVTPTIETAVCLTCGRSFRADFPDDRTDIERVLLARPEENRNWSPGETVDQLRAENAAHGITSP